MALERYGRYGSSRRYRRSRSGNPWSPFGKSYGGSRGDGKKSIEDYFAAAEAEDEDEDEKNKRKPIGVSEDYKTPYQRRLFGMSPDSAQAWADAGKGHGTTGTRGPRYYSDDEWKPGNLRADSVAAIQRAMVEAGILGWGDFIYKMWDEPSAAAYKQVLAASNARGTDWRQTLSEMATSGAQYGGGYGGGGEGGEGGGGFAGFDENGEPIFEFVPPPMPPIKTTNPKDLRRILRNTAIETTGEGWSEAAIDELVKSYNWQEIKIQKDLYAKEVDRMERQFEGEDVGKDVVMEGNMPDPETFFEEQAMKKDPEGFQAGQIVNQVIPDFFQMMEGWA